MSSAMPDPGGANGPVDFLGEVFAAASAGRPIAPDAATWLVGGISAAVRRGDSLDASLGIAASGRHSMQRQLLMLLRDRHLMLALEAVCVSARETDWGRCTRLAPLLRSFLADSWPAVKRLADPPAHWPEWRVQLFRAAATDIDLPTTPRGLYNVAVKRGGACLGHGRRAMLLAQLLDQPPHVRPADQHLRRDWRRGDLSEHRAAAVRDGPHAALAGGNQH